ncbi:protein MRG1-like isoform X2 [Prosopis cineraria]|uniref:protein MRG1-like isoform X2 n=1 Tax=Prosopis cineraria TaxID=364024 RepID=UPI00240F9040|nr:protein MRG1-like isoform X2 [Prosopis cineraria]
MGSSKASAGTADNSATESGTSSSTHSHNDVAHHSDSPPFAEREKVLAYHKGRIYEAKVLRIEYRQNAWSFYVHYPGWKKSWDEWVGLDRLMKYTEENLQKKLAHENDDNDKNTKAARASQLKSKSSNARGKKRKSEALVKEKATVHSDKFVSLQIPPPLKKQLVDDCEFITHLGKLVKLPRTPNVNDIVKKYLDYRSKKDGSIADSVGEIFKGLCCYFDRALPVMLLYKNERKQYQEACPDDITPSTVYGAEHLLRLFVKLPELLFHANIEMETMMQLQAKLVDFLKVSWPRFYRKIRTRFFSRLIMSQKRLRTAPTKKTNSLGTCLYIILMSCCCHRRYSELTYICCGYY